jgi:hypothetical protein
MSTICIEFAESPTHHLHNVEQTLQMLGDQSPLVLVHLVAVELLQAVDTGAADHTVQHVLLLEVAAIQRLVGALDLDGHRRLALLADGDLLVVALDGGDAAHGDDLLLALGVLLDAGDRGVEAEVAVDDVDADDDGVGLVEDGDGTEDAGEDGEHLALLLALGGERGHVLGEVVEEVVDDLGGEDLDASMASLSTLTSKQSMTANSLAFSNMVDAVMTSRL